MCSGACVDPTADPANCGGCAKTGSDKTSETKETTSAKPYACPMHPDVTSDKAGKCPKCGMNLVPQEEKGAGTAEGK